MFDSVSSSGFFPAAQEPPFSPDEEATIQARLWNLLCKQVRLQTQGDHSSLREENAAELLVSMVFSLEYHLHRNGLPIRTLLTADLASLLIQAQDALQHEMDTAKTLYIIALRSVATFDSNSLVDTLAGIGQFFKLYDVRLHAHAIPASIDYPLCVPVSDRQRGVLYIRAYLERLMTENTLVTRFAPARVVALLHRASPDYRELLCNLYEPVAANTVGLSLLGGGETLLEITYAQAAQIHHQIAVLQPEAGRAMLSAAAETACCRLSIFQADSISYLQHAAQSLYPRIIISPQSASGVFSPSELNSRVISRKETCHSFFVNSSCKNGL